MGSFYRGHGNKRFKPGERNIIEFLKQREINENMHRPIRRKLHVTTNLIKRIGLEAELEGHNGCVNCVEWNSAGNLLVSSSDDTHIMLWDPFRKKLLHKFKTVHEGNIFGTKFLPCSSDTKLITGSADYKTVLQDIILKETLSVCTCSSSRVKRIETCDDTPYLYWSASEDGIIRQMDTRIQHECSSGAEIILINLKNHRGGLSEAKCLAINPIKSELLAVGANDTFVRLYDRRMINVSNEGKSKKWSRRPTESGRQNGEAIKVEYRDVHDNLSNGCVQYFTPGHLRVKPGSGRYRYTAVTCVSFSPNGRELLANFGSEQIYLFDINKQHVPKYFKVPCLYSEENDTGAESSVSVHDETFENETVDSAHEKDTLPKHVEDLKISANEYYKDKDFTQAIDIYNHAIQLYNNSAVLYCNRAASLMKRDWKGDMYAALRDCIKALQLNPNYMKAHYRLTRCYFSLKRVVEAKTCLDMFVKKFHKSALSPAFKGLEKDINVSLNTSTTNSTPSISKLVMPISYQEKCWQINSFDYERRYCGHCNTTTDIKEANFFGSNGQFIVAGSDEGSIYFWDRKTETIEHALIGDSSIVNCVQPHKDVCFLASSGIDSVIRLWSPRAEDGSPNERLVTNINCVTHTNQRQMKADPLELIFRGPNGDDISSSSSDEESCGEPIITCRPS